ncbi:MAG: hypothetical protein ACPL4H_10920, partial [Anaerolineales bacterium]
MFKKSLIYIGMLIIIISMVLSACAAPTAAPQETTAPATEAVQPTQAPVTEAPATEAAQPAAKKFTIGISNPFISSEY